MLHTRDFLIVVFWMLITPFTLVGCYLSVAELTACIFRVQLNLGKKAVCNKVLEFFFFISF